MKKVSSGIIFIGSIIFIFSKCSQSQTDASENKKDTTQVSAATNTNGGFESQVKWGEHIVTISGCNDCHTPKKMSPQGPIFDVALALSGHPSAMPDPDISRKEIEGKGLFCSNDLTAWVGPWGVSYAANLTSDSTGIGNWNESQFIYCLRNGKWMGAPDARPLLPPMPWQGFAQMSDAELKAVFAYLKSTKPIHNIVPMPKPPLLAMKQ